MHCRVCTAGSYAPAYALIRIKSAVLLTTVEGDLELFFCRGPRFYSFFRPAAKGPLDPSLQHCEVCWNGSYATVSGHLLAYTSPTDRHTTTEPV